ncbi:MAG: hypothetical protein HXY43_24000 [Fischerella sp.]|jgi:hypothetical protein|uniref:hypothetical protein n=1 Tax=Fischerella sp. TaxID=1191 RepID=UPI0017B2CC28|nr:hypothetical protein [Fischerella sp.]NWF62232.1 hypothetical protein [Fischerella sp.]
MSDFCCHQVEGQNSNYSDRDSPRNSLSIGSNNRTAILLIVNAEISQAVQTQPAPLATHS